MIRLQFLEPEDRTVTSTTALKDTISRLFPEATVTPDFISGYIVDTYLDLGDVYERLERNNTILDNLYKVYSIVLAKKHSDTQYHNSVCIYDRNKPEIEKIVYTYDREDEMIHFMAMWDKRVDAETKEITYDMKYGSTIVFLRNAGVQTSVVLILLLGRLGIIDFTRSPRREGYTTVTTENEITTHDIEIAFRDVFPEEVISLMCRKKNIEAPDYENLATKVITDITRITAPPKHNTFKVHVSGNLVTTLRNRYSLVKVEDILHRIQKNCPEIISITKSGTNRLTIETNLGVTEIKRLLTKVNILDVLKNVYIKGDIYYSRVTKEEM